jgi:hypothetical protein
MDAAELLANTLNPGKSAPHLPVRPFRQNMLKSPEKTVREAAEAQLASIRDADFVGLTITFRVQRA